MSDIDMDNFFEGPLLDRTTPLGMNEVRYFVVHCIDEQQIQESVESEKWQCSAWEDRPETWDYIGNTFRRAPVILLFTIPDKKGWHGYAGLASPPHIPGKKYNFFAVGDTDEFIHKAIAEANASCRDYFYLHWVVTLCKDTDNDSVSYNLTKNLKCVDGVTSANDAKHRQEIGWEAAQDICEKINAKREALDMMEAVNINARNSGTCNKKELQAIFLSLSDNKTGKKKPDKPEKGKKASEKVISKPFSPETITIRNGKQNIEIVQTKPKGPCPDYDSLVGFGKEKKNEPGDLDEIVQDTITKHTWDVAWDTIFDKVKPMGSVVLACPFGSQRYNLDSPESDMDMFIVYKAPTSSLLGFDPPKQSMKNAETEPYDYTIMELHRFCELLLAGDPRCVETLFMDKIFIKKDSVEFNQLRGWKNLFLSKQCVEKYLSDACGARGKLKLEKWIKADSTLTTNRPMAKHLGKHFYIMLRLLQNAEDVVRRHTVRVARPAGSDEHRLLSQARHCQLSYHALRTRLDKLEEEVRRGLVDYQQRERCPALRENIQRWMVNVRYEQLGDELD